MVRRRLPALLFALAFTSCAKHSSPPPSADSGAQPSPSPSPSMASPPVPVSMSVSAGTQAVSPSLPPKLLEPSLEVIDRVVDRAIARGDVPGAVVEIWLHDRLIHRKAYGERRVSPNHAPMAADTVFDLASLTKPIATAMSIHVLVSEKRLALGDRARKYLPELGEEQGAITIEQLLLHTSGLPAGAGLSAFERGEAVAVQKIGALKLSGEPGTVYKYSDVGYVLLGAIVSRVAGEPLDSFADKRIFVPLGLHDTAFKPAPELVVRAAPTCRDGLFLEGVVHDPIASALSGVAGNAGLFSTADDLATFARMMLHGGALGAVRVLPEASVALMTKAVEVPGARRTLGWDAYGTSGYGHTGFTGTSLSVDPVAGSIVILLTSRTHPDDKKGDVKELRKELAAVSAATLASATVLTGIDVLEHDGFARFAGKKVALVTNRSAVDHAGKRTIDVLRGAGVKLVALLTPEHGLDAKADEFVADGVDAATGLPIKSLYGANGKKPVASDLEGAEVIVFDLQDAGVRFYTYETTLGLVLESAKELGLPLVVLDRPNPVGGAVEGPLLDEGKTSFTAYHRTPIRHGMTLGELARFFNGEREIGASLEIVPMRGYRRDMLFADTLLAWVAPSPNLRTDVEALLYPGVALLEGTNVSVGRGTSNPFEVIGAPFIEGEKLAKHLNGLGLPGVSFQATRFTPTSSTHHGVECGGVAITVTNAKWVAPVRLGVALALALEALYPKDWQTKNLPAIVGNAATVAAILRGDSLESIVASWKKDEVEFEARRRGYLVY